MVELVLMVVLVLVVVMRASVKCVSWWCGSEEEAWWAGRKVGLGQSKGGDGAGD